MALGVGRPYWTAGRHGYTMGDNRRRREAMPNVDEIMQDNERFSFTLTMAGEARRAPTPIVLSNGHVIDNVSRKDGSSAWVCQVCERATTPIFMAGAQPFTEETVGAWHDDTERASDQPAHVQELLISGALLADQRKSVQATKDEIALLQAKLSEELEAEDKILRRVGNAIDDATHHMKVSRMARLLKLSRQQVYQLKKRGRTSA